MWRVKLLEGGREVVEGYDCGDDAHDGYGSKCCCLKKCSLKENVHTERDYSVGETV